MADPERDPRVAEGYRALGREEPPPALDAAILAAARRRRSRWAVPVSIAAVVALAVGVVLRVQLEAPEVTERIAVEPKVMRAPAAPAMPESRARAAPPPAEALKLERPAAQAADRAVVAGRASANVAAGKLAAAPPETPERWLERIAGLRKAGRDREADENLAEFRKRYPDYRIPEAMRARIAPR